MFITDTNQKFNHLDLFNSIFNYSKPLFHGSRGGLDGRIRPESRARTDFGPGFYLTDDVITAKTWVSSDQLPVVYSFFVEPSNLESFNILHLSNLEWAYTILHNRRSCEAFNGSDIDEAIGELTKGFDFIIGPIADDNFRNAINLFSQNGLTDLAFIECLSRIPLGYQIVAKTQEACDLLTKISEDPISEEESFELNRFKEKRIIDAKKSIEQIQLEYQGKGQLLSTLLYVSDTSFLRKKQNNQRVLIFDKQVSSSVNQTYSISQSNRCLDKKEDIQR